MGNSENLRCWMAGRSCAILASYITELRSLLNRAQGNRYFQLKSEIGIVKSELQFRGYFV